MISEVSAVEIRKAIVKSESVYRLRMGNSRGLQLRDCASSLAREYVGHRTRRPMHKTPVFPKVLPGANEDSFDDVVRAYEDG